MPTTSRSGEGTLPWAATRTCCHESRWALPPALEPLHARPHGSHPPSVKQASSTTPDVVAVEVVVVLEQQAEVGSRQRAGQVLSRWHLLAVDDPGLDERVVEHDSSPAAA